MRGSRHLTPAAAAIEWVPPDRDTVPDVTAIFGRSAPVEVDLGCGDGSFLAGMAELHLDRDFIGFERMIGRVRSACRRMAARGLTNARIVRTELLLGVSQLLRPASVDVFHLMFPDPWPKRRHHRRRVFSDEFLQALTIALKPGGVLHLATDDADYFAEMQRALGGVRSFAPLPAVEWPELPVSTFEQRFRDSGLPIHRVLLRKVSEVM